MAHWFADYLLLAWILMSVSAIGIVLCLWLTRFEGIELIGYGLAAGVICHGVFGVLIAATERLRLVFILLPVGCAVASIYYLFRRKVWLQLYSNLTRPIRLALLVWLLFLTFCIAIVHIGVRFPASLPDGRYVFKEHTLNVKIQFMTSLPADNYIPYIVEEYLLRHISFREERPIIPGNEVSNRTILMSLVAIPFRAALSWPDYGAKEIGRVNYVGQTWPDVRKLYEKTSFHQFLITGIFLNSLLLVGLIVFFSKFQLLKELPLAALLFATNFYAINQTIFTWPKAMAGFFIVLSWNALRRNFDPKLVGLLTAAAYHCHPSSIAVAASLGLGYAWQSWRSQRHFRPALNYAAVFGLAILPWFFWTRIILKIPSDLFTQNFSGGVAEIAMSSPINFIWVRFRNFFDVLTPLPFSIYPFRLDAVVGQAMICLPFVVGIFFIIPALLECWRLRSEESMLVWFGFVVPAVIILLLFSYPAVPIMHGWQPLVGVLIFLGLFRLRRILDLHPFTALVALQLLCNFWLLVANGVLIGAHFS